MVRRISIALLFVVVNFGPWSSTPVAAQTESATPIVDALNGAATVQFAADQVGLQVPNEFHRPGRGSRTTPLLVALQATTVVTQALDVHSTIKAMDQGAVEANPLMAGIVKNKAAFIGVKAGLGAGFIYATHRMAKRNKVGATVTAAAVNSVYLVVAHHNYKVARSIR